MNRTITNLSQISKANHEVVLMTLNGKEINGNFYIINRYPSKDEYMEWVDVSITQEGQDEKVRINTSDNFIINY